VFLDEDDVMWFATKPEKLTHIRQIAEGVVSGDIDPHYAASDIWHTALPDLDLRPLHRLIDAGDQLEDLERGDPRRTPLEAEILVLIRRLLDDPDFWSQAA
jgi:hypothetical protein